MLSDRHAAPQPPDDEVGVGTWRWMLPPLLLGGAGVVGISVAVRFTELLSGRYIAGGVPPVCAFALLLILLGGRSTVGRLSARLRLSRRQVLLAYTMMCFGGPLAGAYLVRAWLPHLVALRYWGDKLPELAGLAQYLPHWIGPVRHEAVVAYYEGTHLANAVPWADWLRPLAMWVPFLFAVFVFAYCLTALFQRQWIRAERLTFPILYLPLTLTAPDDGGPVSRLWRRHWFWIGVGVAMVFNGLNIAHTIVPSIPAPGFSKSLAPYFTRRPWTPFQTFNLYFMLETIGFGYFIPLEVTFTVWFSYLAIKLYACAGLALGYERPGFPFIHEQCAGAYLTCAAFVLWGSRHHLKSLWRAAWRLRAAPEAERQAWLGLFGSLAFMLWFMVHSGLPLRIAVAFWGVLTLFVLVYARIRAETGAPLEFTYPYWMPKNLVTWGFTPAGIVWAGGPRAAVVFGLYSWLSRHHWANEMAAYQMDTFKLGEVVAIPRRALVTAVTVAFVLGLGASIWAHLSAYYEVGTNLASGSLGNGEYRATVAVEEFKRTASDLSTLPGRPWDRLTYVGGGMVVAGIMAFVRGRVPGWPLHPLGYILATAYGDHNTCIFPLFTAWLAKRTILSVGGLRAYRHGIPFFIGLIAGHFFWAGVFWPLLSLALGPETSRAYHLFFGG